MPKRTKQDEVFEQSIASFFKLIGIGIKRLIQSKAILIIFILIILLTLLVGLNQDKVFTFLGLTKVAGVPYILLKCIWILPAIFLAFLGAFSEEKPDELKVKFESINFCNKAGVFPSLIKREKAGEKEIITLKSSGIPISNWMQKKTDIENALDINILKISQDAKTKTIVKLETVTSDIAIETLLRWDNRYLTPEDKDKGFTVAAGKGLLDIVKFDLDKVPHALIAGTTGSGKSVVLKVLLYQCILKGAVPYMVDFKGGIELSSFEEFGEMVYERQDALELLKELNREMKLRLDLFRSSKIKNIKEYNKLNPKKPLSRIIIACDEVSEMLDKTGLSGADAAIYKEIEAEMSSIARLGRAPGIHMLLGTQRPDVKVITGQIKNNLPIRISGRMTDSYASDMVLGNTKATELGDIQGRFLYTIGSDTYEFQGFLLEDKDIREGNYMKGVMLLNHPEILEGVESSSEFIREDGESKNSGKNYLDPYDEDAAGDDFDSEESGDCLRGFRQKKGDFK